MAAHHGARSDSQNPQACRMNFLIADTLTDSLARLTGDEAQLRLFFTFAS